MSELQKHILRFDFGFDAELSEHGKYVEYEDHVAALADKDARIALMQRAVEWLKGNSLAYTDAQGVPWWVAHDGTKRVSKVPDDIADIIIKPASGESNRA